MDFQQLKREFANPSSDYRLAPFWFLNHDLTDEELRWQINEMHAKGVDGFILHARHGLITPYMSEEWMDRMETCVKEADKLRMKAYLYDEDNWPSGAVGGQLIEQYPEYRMSGCALSQTLDVKSGKLLEADIDAGDGLIGVIAVPTARGVMQNLPQSAVSLMSYITDGKLVWQAPKGNWKVFVFTRKIKKGGTFFGGYLDTLNKNAVAKFIEMTHKNYTERLGEYFGGTVPGIFTDEPSMDYNPREYLPWTPTLPSEFDLRHGYDILGALPAQFMNAGDMTAQLRCDFRDTVTHIYQQAFFKQIYDYCESVRLKSIGHVMSEGEFYDMVRHQGDFFRTAKYMHHGGCDFLIGFTWPHQGDMLNNLVGPKLASSAAHMYGKPRVMSEAFGLAGGWGVDLRLLKRLTDWQIAMGVNLIEPHAFYYSIQGHRKWECPPGEFYQSPFWPYYKNYADYTARLCNLFSGGDHVADIAVVMPTRSMWAAIDPQYNDEAARILNTFTKVTAALLRAGYDFEIIPEEELIENIDTLDLEHLVSGESYKALIFPTPDVLLDETAEFIRECVDDGVPVVLAGNAPKRFVIQKSSDYCDSDDIVESLPPITPIKVDDLANTGAFFPDTSNDDDETDDILLLEGALEASPDKLAKAISALLRELIDPDVIVSPRNGSEAYVGDIIHLHYVKGDTDFYFFANSSDEENYSTTITLDYFGSPSIWDPLTGTMSAIIGYETVGNKLVLNLDFAPTQSYIIAVGADNISAVKPRLTAKQIIKTIQLGDEWIFRTESGNALPIRDWKLEMGSEGPDAIWRPTNNKYVSDFQCETKPSSLRMLVDGLVIEKVWRRSSPLPVEIKVNGVKIEAFEPGSYLDHLILEADISGIIKEGKNTIEINCPTTLAGTGALKDPVILVGDFGLVQQKKEWMLTAPPQTIKTGSWADQGFPYYSGIGVYAQKVKLPAKIEQAVLRMEKPDDLAEITINGKSAATLLWEPWEADITDFVKPGENEITIKVANSLQNLLTGKPKSSGLTGKVEISLS
ncbi:MAG: glycosyl hydrolase [Armatimonadota bacterium]|nr:glycosyl hydrolase [Armatimonadota bacterium]